MMPRILFALACTASIPMILAPAPAHAQSRGADASAAVLHMPHISVQMIGDRGSPVILIPGLSSPREVWSGIAPELAKKHRVYLVQVNGFAGENPRGNLDGPLLAGIVADLHALAASETPRGAAVIGHSLGGLLGLLWAKAHSGDLTRLMIVDSLPFYGVIVNPAATATSIEPQASAMRDQFAASYGQPPNEGVIAAISSALALKPDSRAKVAGWMRATDPRVSARALYEDMTTDLRGGMAAIGTPITLVYPWSAALPKERADAFYRGEYAKAPNVSFVPVGDSAHFVMLDQPAAFAAAVTDFVK